MMRVFALLAAAAFMAAVGAQQPAKPATQEAPKAAVATKAEPPKVAKSEPRKPRKFNPRRQEDARHCLEKPTNTEIIKCAEAYL
jgi:hypothetical protein